MKPFPLGDPIRTATGWSVEAALTEDCEFLRGHFPGQPILPAVAQLALLTQAARKCWNREVSLSAIRDLRFRSPLVPDCQMEVRLGALDDRVALRFGIYRVGANQEDRPVSQGSVAFAERSPRAVRVPDTNSIIETESGPPILLPQVAEARYIRSVIESDNAGLECLATVPAENPFRTEVGGAASVPAFLGLEMGAQAAATYEAVMRAAEGGEARSVGGYVVRYREAVFSQIDLPAEAHYRVLAVLHEAAPPLRTYSVTVRLDERTLVEALVSTFAEE